MERPLTFRPSVDDPAALTNFLKGVHERYLEQKEVILQAMSAQSQGGATIQATLYASAMPSETAPAVYLATAQESQESDYPAVAAASSVNALPSRRRQRAGNNASLLRAKSIDFHAKDPEEDSPPNETDDERRRRKERINGRRKRAKKMIEIDFLNEQYHKIKADNDKLKAENEAFRERIAMLKNLGQSGLIKAQPGDASRAPVSESGLKQAENPQDERKPTAVTSIARVAPLFQYALPPAAMTLRATRDVSLSTPQEESKEAFVQPQFVGQEQLESSGLSLATLRAFQPAVSNTSWMSLTGAPLFSPFFQQQTFPSLSTAVALLSQQQQARNLAGARSIRHVPVLSPIQQVYQNLFALQQQQHQLQQNQSHNTQSSPHQPGTHHQHPPPAS